MTLKTNSFLAKYYRWMFNGSLPNDFCTLFWNTIISVILFPLTSIVYPIPVLRDPPWSFALAGKACVGLVYWLLFFALTGCGLMILDNITRNWETWNFFVVLITSWLLLMSTGAIVCGIIYLIYLAAVGFRHLRSKKLISLEKPGKIQIITDTIRNKYCTKINWK